MNKNLQQHHIQIPLVLTIIFFSYNSFSQVSSIGIKVGGNLSTINMDDRKLPGFADRKYKPGFLLGGFLQYELADQISFQPEVLYIQKGQRISYEEGHISTETFISRSNYLEIPLLLSYEIQPFRNEALKAHFSLGPYFGYWLGASVVEKEFRDVKIISKLDFKNLNANRFEMGLSASTGLMYILNKGALILDIRYSYGLTDTKDMDEQSKPDNYKKATNRTIAVSLGYATNLIQ